MPKRNENIIVLCGGKASRIRNFIGTLPKVLVPIDGVPFLSRLSDQLNSLPICWNLILATGIGSHHIEAYIQNNNIDAKVSREDVALGTGGAILLALNSCKLDSAYVLNGDTIYDGLNEELFTVEPDTSAVFVTHKKSVGRFGSIRFSNDDSPTFVEKTESNESGWVNAGIYHVTRNIFRKFEPGDKFSFETDIMEKSADIQFVRSRIEFEDYGVPKDLFKLTDVSDNEIRDS